MAPGAPVSGLDTADLAEMSDGVGGVGHVDEAGMTVGGSMTSAENKDGWRQGCGRLARDGCSVEISSAW